MKKLLMSIALFISTSSCASDGTLDLSFGISGTTITALGNLAAGQLAIVQPDGKIVAIGYGGNAPNVDFALARYNPDGSLDTSFGTGGLVTTSFSIFFDQAFSGLLQVDGKIIAIGTANGGGVDFALARYNPDGSLDSTFGIGGLVTTDFGGTEQAHSGLLQPDGKIIAIGYSNVSGTDDFALARYNSDGSLDTSFGTGGLVTTDFGVGDRAFSGLLQPDGKIVAIGNRSTTDFALARYNSDGSLDTSFGTGGLVITDFGGIEQADSGLLQTDGKIIAIGSSSSDFALARYNPDGSLDTSFGTGGLVTTDFGGDDRANSGLLQTDGKIIALGSSNASGDNDFALARYNPDGSLDTTFGTGGLVTTDFGAGDRAFSGLLQPDGKVVALGQRNTTAFALARYLIPSVEISALARDLRAKYFLLQ
jgi:uncharacterized delta-60 repeat protein